MSNIQKLAKEWAHGEAASVINSLLSNGNTILSTAEESWLADELGTHLSEQEIETFEKLMDDELQKIYDDLFQKSGTFKGIGI